MKKSAYFSDLAFAFCAAFLPALCFLRFEKIPLFWAAAVAALFGAGISLAVSALIKKRCAAKALKAKDQRETEKFALHLALLSPAEQTAFFAERVEAVLGEPMLVEKEKQANGDEPLKREGKPLPYDGNVAMGEDGRPLSEDGRPVVAPTEGGAVVRDMNKERRFLETKTQAAYCRFKAAPLSADDTLPIVALSTEKIPVLLCNALNEDGKNLVSRFGIRILTVGEIFVKLKESELLPTKYKSEAAFAKRKIRIFSGFTKQNARPFFTGGALILISSLFSPFPYYYLVFGIGLMTVAAVIRIAAR